MFFRAGQARAQLWFCLHIQHQPDVANSVQVKLAHKQLLMVCTGAPVNPAQGITNDVGATGSRINSGLQTALPRSLPSTALPGGQVNGQTDMNRWMDNNLLALGKMAGHHKDTKG